MNPFPYNFSAAVITRLAVMRSRRTPDFSISIVSNATGRIFVFGCWSTTFTTAEPAASVHNSRNAFTRVNLIITH